MEVAGFIVAVLTLLVNVAMLFKMDRIIKNVVNTTNINNKNANQTVRGKNNQSTIQQ